MDVLNCLHGYNKRKVASETDTFGWMLSVVPLVQSDCMIFWSIFWKSEGSIWDYLFWVCSVATYIQSNCRILWRSISLERVKWYLQGKVTFTGTALGWVWSDVTLCHSDSRILWLPISLDGIDWYLCLTIVNHFN